jgi:GNAT superfamily N-acetyltransferase
MNISIRRASEHDIETLLAINQSSFEANKHYDQFIDMNWIHTQHALKLFTDAVSNDGYYTSIAEVDNQPAGFLMLGPKHLTYRTVKMIELEILAVLPEFRSKGIGKLLLENAKEWARSTGYQTMYVTSYSKNARAITFYNREHFAPVDTGLEVIL